MIKKSNLSSIEEVVLAAFKLLEKGKKEFTEWDLTVEAWKTNPNRWGLKNYELLYPDHKRVMNEIMSNENQKVLGKGWLERIRPNIYRITPLGIAKAKSLVGIKPISRKRNADLYEAINPYVTNKSFQDYYKNKEEPMNWLNVASFLKLNKYDKKTLNQTMSKIENTINDCIKWLDENNENILIKGDSKGSEPIIKDKLFSLKEFLEIIQEKFRLQFEAIRKK